MIEIERKFLVTSKDFKEHAVSKEIIKQGFLSTHPERTVRVRIKGGTAYLTVKGKSSENGLSRFEWETEIPVTDAQQLLILCEDKVLEKTRHTIPVGNHIFEVDEFHGIHQGLLIAEVELRSEDDKFEKPYWLGQEVTGDIRYYNSQLSEKNM